MSKLATLFNHIGVLARQNAPALLVGAGTASVCSAAILTGRATIKAMNILDEAEALLPPDEELDRRAIIKHTWTLYIPPIALMAVGIGCFIASNKVMSRRNAALASAYSIADVALKEYKDKVVEIMGEESEEKIRESIAQDHLNNNGVTGREILITGRGDHLCYDTLSGRYFESDLETIRKAENDLSRMLINETFTSLNTFYSLLGLDSTRMGGDLGWTTDDMPEFIHTAKVADNGRPCLVIDYTVEPKADYFRNIR